MAYESPIHVYTTEISQKIAEECDRIAFEEIKRVGVYVEKDELIKALEYDRDQYQKGFRDGRLSIGRKTGYEELVKALREHAKPDGWDCSVCMCRDAQNRGFFTCTEELAAKAADAIEELTDRIDGEWIPISERFPDEPPKEE